MLWFETLIPDSIDSWVVQVFIVILLTVILNFTQKHLLNKLHVIAEHTRSPWDEALIYAIQKPLYILIWVLGVSFSGNIIWQETQSSIFSAVPPIRDVAVIAVLTLFLTRLLKRIEHNLIQSKAQAHEDFDHTTLNAITRLLRLSVFITAALVALQTLGFSISGVLAFGGIGGMAVGLAARELLANFFGGLTIYMNRPFKEGDWIRSPDKSIEGVVERIGWRQTIIRTFDKRPLYVPNAVFTSIAVENPSRMSNRRIYETIGIRYDDASKMRDITREVKAMLNEHSEIDQQQTLIVNFNQYAPSSLDFFIYCFTHTTEWVRYHEIKEDVLLRIMEIIQRNGAECAFPTSTLHIVQEPKIEAEISPFGPAN